MGSNFTTFGAPYPRTEARCVSMSARFAAALMRSRAGTFGSTMMAETTRTASRVERS